MTIFEEIVAVMAIDNDWSFHDNGAVIVCLLAAMVQRLRMQPMTARVDTWEAYSLWRHISDQITDYMPI